jgi:hypothetical protein
MGRLKLELLVMAALRLYTEPGQRMESIRPLFRKLAKPEVTAGSTRKIEARRTGFVIVTATLRLPTVWDLGPDSYFQRVILQRMDGAAHRHFYDLINKARVNKVPKAGDSEPQRQATGADTRAVGDNAAGGSPGAFPAGRALTQAENDLARKHAPKDKDGKVKCWDAASHMGCKKTASTCFFSHAPIQGQLH